MTTVTASMSGGIYRIEAHGHATGSVEVCSAVSAIICTLEAYAKKRCNVLRCKVKSAHVILEFAGDNAGIAYEMTLEGLLRVQKAEPEYLTVKKR